MKGVTDALRRLDGAGEIRIDLQSGTAVLYPSPGAHFRPGEVSAAILHSGNRAGVVTVVATGIASAEQGRWVFRLPGDPEPYLVVKKALAVGPLTIRARISPDGTVLVESPSAAER